MQFKSGSLSLAGVLLALGALQARAAVVVLPDVDVTVQTPTAPRLRPAAAPVEAPSRPATPERAAAPAESPPRVENVIDRSPANATHIGEQAIQETASPNVVDTLTRIAPSVTVQDVAGNPFQADVEYRGFVASPVEGTPQGLAVYQNGVRINEAFGDTVNWDLIPTFAVLSIDLVANNPAFGLNALGGALNLRMKDGFNSQGGKAEVFGGSYGRIQTALEYGKTVGAFAFYGALEFAHDDGYRQQSSSNIRRFYGDLGYRAEGNELHLNVGLASNSFGAAGPSPIQMLQQNWGEIYTSPQTNDRQFGMVNLTGQFALTSSWTLNANAYVRRYIQHTVDGNPTNVQLCADGVNLCYNDTTTPANGLNGAQLPNTLGNGVFGEIDRTVTLTTSAGTSFQLSNTDSLFGHRNRFSLGVAYDFGATDYSASAELGTIGPDYVTTGAGVYLGASGNPVTDGPVLIHTFNRYLGVHALDAFDVTDDLTLSAGARLNYASISLIDQLDGNVNGDYQFTHINPLAGFTYKITPNFQAYGSYAEGNRAPTPLELGCADPMRPCILASFLISDPALKQVISRTFEAGFRGQRDFGDWGALSWKLGAFRTRNQDDILNVPSPFQTGFGYFTNVGATLRQGVEASLNYRYKEFVLRASYTYLDATFLNSFALASNSPSADANGLIYVTRGDQIPMLARHRVKLGGDWDITAKARIGADLLYVGPQRFAGDASNQQPRLPGYVTVSLNASYKLLDNVEIFARATNLFDNRYYTYGTFFDTTQVFGNFTDPRTLTPAQPLSVYGGLRVTFDAPVAAATTVAARY